ncbi:MAG: hypothetical protein CM1200mP41_02090 [Gammaproteobacteria bacterium]|nr:MAG: hypothetical protein CM1200mP41_02090 [Gammaproteobacteria bacterium]
MTCALIFDPDGIVRAVDGCRLRLEGRDLGVVGESGWEKCHGDDDIAFAGDAPAR